MEQEPGEQPSRTPKKKVEARPETPSQTISGRGQVLLIREFLKQEDSAELSGSASEGSEP